MECRKKKKKSGEIGYITGLKTFLRKTLHDTIRPNYKVPFSMDCRERGFHSWSMYLEQDTSCMETAGMKQEEESKKNNWKERVRNQDERNRSSWG